MVETVAGRLALVRARIAEAARAAGRAPDQIRLVAVSKKKSAERVREAYEAGQRDFGENYVQEFVAKARELADLPDIRWHMIGHLQTNKVKHVLKVASMVQTVDRVRLAQELGKRAEAEDKRVAVLVELNVGGEVSKTGGSVEQAAQLVQEVRAQRGLELRGLMTVPPFELEPKQVAVHFRRLRELANQFRVTELSMGMSHDFEVAIEHGATMVRVGTAIFGPRDSLC